MTVRTWNGATADIRTVADWTPSGVLAPGDTGIITTGAVLANDLALDGYTLLLRGNGLDVPPTLELSGSTLGANETVRVQSSGGLATTPTAAIDLNGTDGNAGQISVGTAATPASLQMQMASPQSELVNTGTITAATGSTITIASGQVVNGGRMVAAGGTLVLNTQMTGTGSIIIGRDAAGNGGTVVADQTVGSGESVMMHGGTLELASPHFFLGTLVGWDSGTTLDLLHTQATSADVSGGVLTIHDGMFTEAQIKLAGSYGNGDFHLFETPDGSTLVTTTHLGPFG
jgi:hypothetical protein